MKTKLNRLAVIVCMVLSYGSSNGQCVFQGCPTGITQSTTGCETVVNFPLPTSDCGLLPPASVTQTSALGSGDLFPLGTTTVSYEFTDPSNLQTITCSFDVNITRTLVVNGALNVSLDGASCLAEITVAAAVTNVCTDVISDYSIFVTVNGIPRSNAILTQADLGAAITYTVIDPTGNMEWGNILLEDKAGPVFTSCANDITIQCGDDVDDLILMGQPIASDCSGAPVLTYEDEAYDEPCTATGVTFIRTWTATDDNGDTNTCEQMITVVRGALVMPAAAITIQCEDLDDSGEPNATQTGAPMMGGTSIVGQHVCGYTASVSDTRIETCGSSFKILRTYNITDCCVTPFDVSFFQQSITVEDLTGPAVDASILASGTGTVFNNQLDCNSIVSVPAVGWTDACGSTPLTYETTISVGANDMVITGNGGTFTDVPLGTHPITWSAEDACGNVTEHVDQIEVTDNMAPTAICDVKVVSLDEDGMVCVPASVFDDESTDNCGIIAYKVKRMDADADDPFTSCLTLTCDDVGNTFQQIVRLRVYDQIPGSDINADILEDDDSTTTGIDENGRFSECMVSVMVQEKLHPTVTAPANITVSCGVDFTAEADYIDTDNPIEGFVSDNCNNFSVMVLPDTDALSACGTGTFTRNWLVLDTNDPSWAGLTVTQTITVNPVAWDGDANITWPVDYTADCSDPTFDINNLPGDAAGPVFANEDGVCEMLFISSDDVPFTSTTDGSCEKTLRTWIVIDMCQADNNPASGEPGYWSHIQVISINDSADPVFSSLPGDIVASSNSITSCSGSFNIPQLTATDICAGTVDVDVYINNVLQNQTDTAVVITADAVVSFEANDGCGNVATHSLNVTIGDTQRPQVTCYDLATVVNDTTDLNANGTVTLWASDFINASGTSDNCTAFSDLVITGRVLADGEALPSADAPDTDGDINFDCSTLGQQSVAIWVCDQANNCQVIECSATIQDNLGVCDCEINESISFTTTTNCNSGNGSASVQVGDGSNQAGYTYLWSNGATVDNITLQANGQYSVTVTEIVAAGQTACSSTITGTINCTGTGGMRIGGLVSNEVEEFVEDVEVEITGIDMLPYLTTADGSYMFDDVPMNNNYTIAPTKNTNHNNGVTTFDLVKISRHILDIESLDSPYKIIAADVNHSESVTTLDIVELRRLILNITTAFPNNTSWRFVDRDFIFVDESNPFQTTFPEVISFNDFTDDELAADFVAIKVGDVNCSALANNLIAAEDRTNDHDLVLTINDQQLVEGELALIEVKAAEASTFTGFQFTMNFDGEAIDISDVHPGVLPQINTDNFGMNRLDKGQLTSSWSNAKLVKVEAGEILFTLEVKAKQASRLSDILSLNSNITAAEAYDENDETMGVALVFNHLDGTSIVDNSFELYQNRPNPYDDATTIGFNLPKAGAASLRIFDVSGKLVKYYKGDFAKGYNEVTVEADALNTTGVLYYQLESSSDVATKKMILLD